MPAMNRVVIELRDGRLETSALFHDRNHASVSHICPLCDKPLSTVGIVHLAYTFAPCNCSAAEYEHLYEQLWHLACLVDHVIANRGREP